ncbi:MAG TPA: hypothetical protein DEA67_05015 [Selenomonas sp.]|nr:hypothetical protein [Selenomonas sp.]
MIFVQELSGQEKRQLLEQKYDMQLTSNMGKELDSMCNLSEGIYERGEVNGRDLEKQSTVERLIRKGWDLTDIADATDWSVEQIKSFLKRKKLQLS